MSRAQLRTAAHALGDLTERVVFLGGASVHLWITDPTTRAPRVTYDVDVVIEVTTLAGYADFQEQLRGRGYREDIDSGVICRWQRPATGLVLDAIPVRHELAGLSGRWLADAAAAAVTVTTTLEDDRTIPAVPAAWLIVLKLEAYASRGDDDVLQSRDVEDIILLVDGREELADEVAALPSAARTYVADQLRALTGHRFIDYAVEGALAAADARARATAVTLPRLHALAAH